MMITGFAAGVPYVALPPATGEPNAPIVVVWHLLDAPRTEVAMASALPLFGVPAWRVYLGLPMTGSRVPAGGPEEFMKLVFDDAVLNVFEPITAQAVAEFPQALAELRAQLSATGPVSLVGGSIGSLVALRVLTQTDVLVERAALISPVTQLAPMISANERMFGVPYAWSEASRAVAEKLDFVARAGEIGVPVLLVAGEDDDQEGFVEPARRLWSALSGASLVTVPGMGHALAEEPGVEAAPQTPNAARVDAIVTDWLNRSIA